VPKKKKNPHSRMCVGKFIGLETRNSNVRKLMTISLKRLILPPSVNKTAKARYEISSTLTDQIGALKLQPFSRPMAGIKNRFRRK
jgi:hypothetical protein